MFYKTLEKMSCLITMCAEVLIMKYGFQKVRKMTYFKVWKGYPGIRDLTRNIVRGIDGVRDSTATWEAGFVKILARDAELQGKKVVYRREMTDVGMRDFREKVAGMQIQDSSSTICYLTLHLQ